jgi:hypothetical protein
MNGSEVCFVRAIRGPVTVITLGILFVLNNFTSYSFSETWPVLLIVFGLLSLWGRGSSAPPPRYPPPQWNYPPPPYQPTGGSYRGSSYTGMGASGAPPSANPESTPREPQEQEPGSTPGGLR